MSIWSKILVGLVFVATLPLFYLAARALRTEQVWKTAAGTYVDPIEKTLQNNKLLLEGDDGSSGGEPRPGIRQKRVELHDMLVDRGRVWQNCAPGQVTPAGEASVTVEMPDPSVPHKIQDNMVVYVFDQRNVEEGGAYLGEFKVVGIAENQISLAPTMRLTQRELTRLAAAAAAPWVLYERMPGDRHETFAGSDPAQLAALMPGVPPEVLDEFARDGQDAGPDDPPERVNNGKYERALRDYALYTHELHAQIASLNDQIVAANTDKALAEKTRKDVERLVDLRKADIDDKLQPELVEAEAERDLVKKHHASLDKAIAAVQAEVLRLLSENQRLAAEYTAIQRDAARRIDSYDESQASLNP